MHELSIAMSIIELAQEESHRHGDVQVSAVHLKLGALSGVVKEALLGSFEVPVLIFCRSCQTQRPVSSMQLFCCAECGAPSSEVVQGKEIEMVALEIEEWDRSPV